MASLQLRMAFPGLALRFMGMPHMHFSCCHDKPKPAFSLPSMAKSSLPQNNRPADSRDAAGNFKPTPPPFQSPSELYMVCVPSRKHHRPVRLLRLIAPLRLLSRCFPSPPLLSADWRRKVAGREKSGMQGVTRLFWMA